MTCADLKRRLALSTICDDFEDIERITNPVHEMASACGLAISHDEIIQVLRELIELGYAKAWDLRRWPEDRGTSREDIEPLNPGFVRTDEGLAFQALTSTEPAPRSREELVRLFVLDSYQNSTHIRLGDIERRWRESAETHEIKVSRDEFIQALRHLIGLGYLTTSYRDEYWLYDGMPPLEEIKPFGAYFWVTGAGWDFLDSDPDWWPFDKDADEQVVRKDWTLPES